jgi:hypothetical protein
MKRREPWFQAVIARQSDELLAPYTTLSSAPFRSFQFGRTVCKGIGMAVVLFGRLTAFPAEESTIMRLKQLPPLLRDRLTLAARLAALVALSAPLASCGGGGTPPRSLASIAVTPASTSVPVGLSYQFKATGTYTDASTADLTATTRWASDTPAIVTASPTSGSVHAEALGQATISATSGTISGSALVNVVAATLQYIAVTPNPFSTGIGIARQMTVIGTYSDASTSNLTSTSTWMTLDSAVATVTAGRATGVSLGSTTVNASSGMITGSAPLSVTTKTWSATGHMVCSAQFHSGPPGLIQSGTATLLPSGKVLAVGGCYVPGLYGYDTNYHGETYDPVSSTWSSSDVMTYTTGGHTATLLPNGTVLIAGGRLGTAGSIPSAEIYDPITDKTMAAGYMQCPRAGHTATLLPNGKVLVVGGSQLFCGSPPTTVELYDPLTNTWTVRASTLILRFFHTAPLLPSGKVLIVGGTPYPSSPNAEIYDPVADA